MKAWDKARPRPDNKLEHIASIFAKCGYDLGFRTAGEISDWIALELGHPGALEGRVARGGSRARAIPPRAIYHVLAGNLAVSALGGLLVGLVLGSKLFFKIPSKGLEDFEEFCRKLPREFKKRICYSKEFDQNAFGSCDAVVIYGNDETVAHFRGLARIDQRFIGYGHKISGGWLSPESLSDENIRAAAQDIVTYNQSGCLSPQFYYSKSKKTAREFARQLAEMMPEFEEKFPRGEVDFGTSAWIYGARQESKARGFDVWHAPRSTAWTVVCGTIDHFKESLGQRFVQICHGKIPDEFRQQWRGRISTVAHCRDAADEAESWALEMGACRLCGYGRMQLPPIAWIHDGRPRLADLVTWVFSDSTQIGL